MKPLQLIMQAFGPYKGREELDFTDLQDRRMFLITGPTGAGKTTVLDAMVYALFGDPSGDVRTTKSVRSDFADPHTVTMVQFTFAIGDKQYRVERHPAQQIPKKRGNGFKSVNSSVLIEKWDGLAWQSITESTREASTVIQELIGFRKEQFLQVVLLPQGEFRKLLVANTAEREALLHHIFKTYLYRSVQEHIKSDYDAVFQSVKDYAVEEEQLLQHITDDPDTPMVRAQHLADYLAQQESQLPVLVDQKELAKTALQQVEALRQQWVQYERAQVTVVTAKDALARLDAQRAPIVTLEEKVQALQDLAPLLTTYEKQQDVANRLQAVQVQIDIGTQQLQESKDMQAQWEKEQQALLAEQSTYLAHKQWMDVYEEHRSVFDRGATLDAMQEKLTALAIRKEVLTQQWEATKAKVSELAMSWRRLELAVREQANLSAQVERCQIQQERLDGLQQQYEECAVLYTKIAESKATLPQLQEEAQQQHRIYEGLAQTLSHSQAYQLSHGLQAGAPCPVCGSTEHPQLALPPDAQVTVDDVDHCQQTWRQAEEVYQQAVTEYRLLADDGAQRFQALREKASVLGITLTAWDTAATVIADARKVSGEQYKKMHDAYKANIQQVAQYDEYRHQWEVAQEQAQQEEKALQDITKVWEVQGADYQMLRQQYDNSVALLHLTDESSLPQKLDETLRYIEHHEADIIRIEKGLADAKATVHRREERLSVWREEVATLARENEVLLSTLETGYVAHHCTTADIQQALLAQKDLDSMQQRITDFQLQYERQRGQLEAAQAQLQATPKPTEEVTDERYAAVQRIFEVASDNVARFQAKLDEYRRVLQRVTDLEAKMGATNERLAFLQPLMELATGGEGGLKGVTFERFVLGAILDEVVEGANRRLQHMSGQRYSLERMDYSEGGRGKKGLDLGVMDSYTGQVRPANSLSGGETFLASLALALGLADVIQSYAGGIHMDTIFIDEGFGTLDPDTLDMAMETLVRLQADGRLIGIISHVPELKERIPNHLVVTRTNQGSSVRFHLT